MHVLSWSSHFNFQRRSVNTAWLAFSLLLAAKALAVDSVPIPAEIFSGSEELKTPELRQAGVAEASATMPAGPYKMSWESVRENYRTPEWFRDAKFGIFLHWGLYAVPAHGSEWYVRHIYTADSLAEKWHIAHFGPLDKFGYKDFIPSFTAAKWDPDAWARLFKDAGARYVIPTGEHHDGFSLWDSAINPYNAKAMGPKRDLIGDLAAAVRKEGLKFGVSNHSNIHFNFVPRLEHSDEFDPAWAEFYSVADRSDAARGRFMTKWVLKNLELIDKYQPDMLWFDMSGNDRTWDAQKLAVAAYYYNRARQWGKEVSLSTKGAAYLAGSIKDYERGRAPGILGTAWQEDTSIAHNTWGYTEEIRYRTVGEIVRELVDCVSKNGNFLLNLAPRADGTIPEEQQWRLEAIGEWFRVNGEAIYGTRPWIKYGEGDYRGTFHKNVERGLVDAMLSEFTAKDIRFTTKNGVLYAILLAWPADNTALITSLGTSAGIPGTVTSVQLLGNKGELHFSRDAEGLKIAMPNPPIRPCDYAFVLKIAGLNAHPEPGVE